MGCIYYDNRIVNTFDDKIHSSIEYNNTIDCYTIKYIC